MHDAVSVRPRQPGGDTLGDGQHSIDGQSSRTDQLAQRVTAHHLHHDEADAVLLADIVDGGDVRVVEPRREARLLLEPRPPLGVGGDFGRQHLDRNVAVEPGVGGLVDRTHAALADLGDDLVVA